jgi:hypothetical protein
MILSLRWLDDWPAELRLQALVRKVDPLGYTTEEWVDVPTVIERTSRQPQEKQ